MHSRAYLLIRRDLESLMASPPPGLSLVSAADLFSLHFRISGLTGSVWADAALSLRLDFSSNYNAEAPTAVYLTIPFHPNVCPDTGEVKLHSEWSGCLSSYLISLQHLLSSPLAGPGAPEPANEEALRLFTLDAARYDEIETRCVLKSRELVDDEPMGNLPSVSPRLPPRVTSVDEGKERRSKPVSFDEYFSTWHQIGTSSNCDVRNLMTRSRQASALQGRETCHPPGVPANTALMSARRSRQMAEHLVARDISQPPPSTPQPTERLTDRSELSRHVVELAPDSLLELTTERQSRDVSRDLLDTEASDLLSWTRGLDFAAVT